MPNNNNRDKSNQYKSVIFNNLPKGKSNKARSQDGRSTRKQKKAQALNAAALQNQKDLEKEAQERAAIREESERNFFEGRMEEGADSRIAGEMLAKVGDDLISLGKWMMQNPLSVATYPLRHPVKTAIALGTTGTTLGVAATLIADQAGTALEDAGRPELSKPNSAPKLKKL